MNGKIKNYEMAITEIKSLLRDHDDFIATLGNVTAVLKQRLKFFWVGFYLLKGNELVLGPFQGTPACTRISLGKGVCGAAAQRRQTVVVPDVHQFPGHIACDVASNSEIVVPLFDRQGRVRGVLDVDSIRVNDFHDIDRKYLEEVAKALVKIWD